jgi:hypothetical protein
LLVVRQILRTDSALAGADVERQRISVLLGTLFNGGTEIAP